MAEGQDNKESKTEEATPHKKEELRKKGQVAQSKEIGNATILLAISILFYFYGPTFLEKLSNIAKSMFMRIESFVITEENIVNLLMEMLTFIGTLIAPLLILSMIIGFLASYFQTGPILSTENFKFDLNKINPINGFQRLFSMKSAVESIKAILKLTIISSVVYFVVSGEIEGSITLADQTANEALVFIGKAIFKTLMYVSFLMIVLAIMDYIYQKLKFEADIKMTKQEVKEELRDREGDPNIKARVRSLQRQRATKRMMDDVPKAQVVITNPTHIAIAIEYNAKMGAPKVVAKGADYVAEKIRSIAKANKIPLVENKELARTLYKLVKVGHYVPENLYNAVAEVLVYVMRMKNDFGNIFTNNESGEMGQSEAST